MADWGRWNGAFFKSRKQNNRATLHDSGGSMGVHLVSEVALSTSYGFGNG